MITPLPVPLSALQNAGDPIVGSLKVPYFANGADVTQGWGILEASRKVSVVRSASVARTQAIRSLPAPPRDSETRLSKPTTTPTTLDDLLREELR
jgi:hypothetical protein